MKTEYFLSPYDLFFPLRKLVGNEILYWYDTYYCEWVNFYTKVAYEKTKKYKEITEEEAFRYILEH